MQARHSSSGAVNDVSGMIRTIIPHSLVKAILASHNETKSNRCSSMAIVAQVWPPLPSEHASQALVLCMLTRKRRPYLSNDCSLFHCVRQGWPSQDYEE